MRKQLKKQAKQTLKKHYWILVLLCLIAGFIGSDYTGGISYLTSDEESLSDSVYSLLASGDFKGGEALSKYNKTELEKSESKIGRIALGHSRGVLAGLFNDVSSGDYMVKILSFIRTIGLSKNITIAIFIVLGLLVNLFFILVIFNPFAIVFRRIIMEARIYQHVPIRRFLYLFQVKRFWNVVLTSLLTDVYMILWSLTIVGGFIKSYSYMLVPYILAENPDIKPKEAILLSRKMMDGHKWEAFVLSLSFFGWILLGFITLGISDILFLSPYKAATEAEYYSYLRSLAIENKVDGANRLNDVYLYELAGEKQLQEAYEDILPVLNEPIPEVRKHTGLRGILENVFGITPVYDEDERLYQLAKAKDFRIKGFRAVMNQKMYPQRLHPLRNNETLRNIRSLHYDRHYSISTVVFIFFILSGIGWLWEVSLHLVEEGVFRNRGILHGPWLPVYGSGCVLILICLNKLRKHPWVQFLSAVLLCGIVEYISGWVLEITHNGKKWWDYSGYLLNIDGRVCAEGLLVFGLGGIALVYFLAPLLDSQFRRIPKAVARVICAVLLVVFSVDLVYSHYHPNMGKGVTSEAAENTSDSVKTSKLDQEEIRPNVIVNDNGAIVRHINGGVYTNV